MIAESVASSDERLLAIGPDCTGTCVSVEVISAPLLCDSLLGGADTDVGVGGECKTTYLGPDGARVAPGNVQSQT